MLTDAELAEIEARATAQPDLAVGTEFEDELYEVFVPLAVAGDYQDWLLCPALKGEVSHNGIDTARALATFHQSAKPTILRLCAALRRLRGERDQAEGEAAGWQSRYESLLADKVKAHYDLQAATAELDRLRGILCETCAEWKPKYCDYSDVEGYGVCLLSTRGDHNTDERIIDATWSDSHVHTKPDFGCVCWRPR